MQTNDSASSVLQIRTRSVPSCICFEVPRQALAYAYREATHTDSCDQQKLVIPARARQVFAQYGRTCARNARQWMVGADHSAPSQQLPEGCRSCEKSCVFRNESSFSRKASLHTALQRALQSTCLRIASGSRRRTRLNMLVACEHTRNKLCFCSEHIAVSLRWS